MASDQSSSVAPSAASPPSLAPAPSLSFKPETAASPAPLTPATITRKEWVIPPRPKPGRKPATDAPPTKRKAQNRAAQRAFRERRAARVGELEEHIKKIEDEHDDDESELRDHISMLNAELETFKNEIEWWKSKCLKLERDLDAERSSRETRKRTSNAEHNKQSQQETVPSSGIQLHQQIFESEAEQHQAPEQDQSIGCGNCSADTHCECIEQAFNIANMMDLSQSTKRPQSPQISSDPKRQRSNPEAKHNPEELETDFTAQFSNSKSASTEVEPADPPTTAVVDPCGFCQNDTPCICAEMAAGISGDAHTNGVALSQFTPPPSDGDVLPSSFPTTQAISSNPNSCANGPGTCAQCLSDPNSTLFCKTLAASRSASASGGCGGPTSNGYCCQTRSVTAKNLSPTSTSSSSLRLSCADAYTTLSRHRNYTRASDDMGVWLPKLHALPSSIEQGHGANQSQIERGTRRSRLPHVEVDVDVTNRPAMDIEAASVMGVLKYFDRRFGKGI